MLNIVLGCAKFGGFITTATVKYPLGSAPKLLILSDSTTALGKWKKVSLPDGVTEHLSPPPSTRSMALPTPRRTP